MNEFIFLVEAMPKSIKKENYLGKYVFPSVLKEIDNDIHNSVFSFIPNTAETSFYGMAEAAQKHLDEQKVKDIIAQRRYT